MRRGKSAAYRKAILEGLYQAMRETFEVPEHDRFMTITEHDEDNFVYGADYLGTSAATISFSSSSMSATPARSRKNKIFTGVLSRN
jgi:hypothetical protein